jgi:beta-barrel assembly-enhancing protease
LVVVLLFIGLEWQAAGSTPAPASTLSPNPQSLVHMVGQRLAASDQARQTLVSFTFKIVPAGELSNAFSMPGGGIYISRGLFEQLNTEGELAAILSHEIGHVLLDQTQASAPGSLSFSAAAPGAAGPQSELTLEQLAHRRQLELDADFLGMCLMQAAGYDPAEMLTAISILTAALDPGSRQPAHLSTHPDPDLRQEQIKHNLSRMDACP